MAQNEERPDKGPGNVFVAYTKGDLGDYKPVSTEYEKSETDMRAYLEKKAELYIPFNSIPNFHYRCFAVEDMSELPLPSGRLDVRDLEDAHKESPPTTHSLLEACYCIENSRMDYMDKLTELELMFDPRYALYQSVNDTGNRHFYRDMDEGTRGELLRRLNDNNPKLHLTELPVIGGKRQESQAKEIDRDRGMQPGVLFVVLDNDSRPIISRAETPLHPDITKNYTGEIHGYYSNKSIIPDLSIEAHYFDRFKDIPTVKLFDGVDYKTRIEPVLNEKSYGSEKVNLRDAAYCYENGIEPLSKEGRPEELIKNDAYRDFLTRNEKGLRKQYIDDKNKRNNEKSTQEKKQQTGKTDHRVRGIKKEKSSTQKM